MHSMWAYVAKNFGHDSQVAGFGLWWCRNYTALLREVLGLILAFPYGP